MHHLNELSRIRLEACLENLLKNTFRAIKQPDMVPKATVLNIQSISDLHFLKLYFMKDKGRSLSARGYFITPLAYPGVK